MIVAALTDLVTEAFLRNALIAGTAIAAAAGLVGYFVVLRGQVFTGDALSHVAFTSALAALAVGIDVRLGLVVGTVSGALVIGLLGRRGRADDVVIGSVLAWVLGLGVLFGSLYTTNRSAGNGAAGVNVLFGSIYGLDGAQTAVAVVVAVVVVGAMLVIARPLLFATIDEAVAAARGVPVRAVGLGFLVLVGLTAAQATQAVGALLLLGLLAAPAGIAQQLTARPVRAMLLSAAIGVGSVWTGLVISNVVSEVPPSFAIVAVVSVAYAATLVIGRVRSSASFHAAAERPR
jgi:zinc/manganese transport system permease protein